MPHIGQRLALLATIALLGGSSIALAAGTGGTAGGRTVHSAVGSSGRLRALDRFHDADALG